MRTIFVDANTSLAEVAERLHRADDMPLQVNRQPDITPREIPALLGDAAVAIIDHTHLPTEVARACVGLRHVVFLGTGARSYMNPEELAALGIEVHLIKGYGDTAVAECAFGLLWTAAKRFAHMDRGMRAGKWLRTNGVQLTGKTLGLIGFGGIASEMARLSLGAGMKVLAWNRTPKSHPNVEFVSLETLLRDSHAVSMHLLLNDETRGFLSRDRIAMMRAEAILVNTARGALVDEAAMLSALRSGKLGHAALDVFDIEPLPGDHPLTTCDNVTLSAHSAFRTPEAAENLLEAALEHMRRIRKSDQRHSCDAA